MVSFVGPKVVGHALARVIGASTTRCDSDFWPTDIGVKREFLTIFLYSNMQKNKALQPSLAELIIKISIIGPHRAVGCIV